MPVGLTMLALKESLQTAHSKILREANGSGIATTASVANIFEFTEYLYKHIQNEKKSLRLNLK